MAATAERSPRAGAAALTKADVARRILTLPRERQGTAVLFFQQMVARGEAAGARAHARRVPADRRRYADDPWAYFRDILGWKLTPQLEALLAFIESTSRGLVPSGNNLGKTFTLSGYGVYRFDAVAALPDEDRDLEEQGARILLPGPDHPTILKTIYAAMLEHAARAERRGHLMPGVRSEKSVSWTVRPFWDVEAFSPPAKVAQDVAHTASGRHHRNQVALVEEGQGVPERVWRGAEGMCSSPGNKIVSPFNPTETSSPAYKRAMSGLYRVHHLSAFEHPNVLQRKHVIPDAIDFQLVDARVRAECADRGEPGAVAPDPQYHDFLYALPPLGPDGAPAPERGPRADGVLGHPDGEVRVYRPGPTFTAQVLGRWPAAGAGGLFEPATLQVAVARWKASRDPMTLPDAVGTDVAREGSDDTMAAPRWGESAETLLRAYADAVKEGAEAVKRVVARRMRVGRLSLIPKGDGPDTAVALRRLFPSSPLHLDLGGGASAHDHLTRVLGTQSIGVWFSEAAPEPTPGEPWSENMRAAMYIRAARLVLLGLVDVPDDPALLEELLAHYLIPKARTVTVTERGVEMKKRVESMLLVDKAVVKREIGRSPDRSDAFVLAVNDFPLPVPAVRYYSGTYAVNR